MKKNLVLLIAMIMAVNLMAQPFSFQPASLMQTSLEKKDLLIKFKKEHKESVVQIFPGADFFPAEFQYTGEVAFLGTAKKIFCLNFYMISFEFGKNKSQPASINLHGSTKQKSNFSISAIDENNKNYLFMVNRSGYGGYFIQDESGALIINGWDHPWRQMTPIEIQNFNDFVALFIRAAEQTIKNSTATKAETAKK